MSDSLRIDESSSPQFPRHVRMRYDETRSRWVVLAPEHVLMPDDIAVEILRRCDGVVTVGAIADELALKYQAPRDQVGADVVEVLQGLADKGLLTT